MLAEILEIGGFRKHEKDARQNSTDKILLNSSPSLIWSCVGTKMMIGKREHYKYICLGRPMGELGLAWGRGGGGKSQPPTHRRGRTLVTPPRWGLELSGGVDTSDFDVSGAIGKFSTSSVLKYQCGLGTGLGSKM